MATLTRQETAALRKVVLALEMFAQPRMPCNSGERIEIATNCADLVRTILTRKGARNG